MEKKIKKREEKRICSPSERSRDSGLLHRRRQLRKRISILGEEEDKVFSGSYMWEIIENRHVRKTPPARPNPALTYLPVPLLSVFLPSLLNTPGKQINHGSASPPQRNPSTTC